MKRAVVFVMGIAALFGTAAAFAEPYYWGRADRFASDIDSACAIASADDRYTYNGSWSSMSETQVACSWHGPWGNENVFIYRYTCANSEHEFNDDTGQCEEPPPPVECPVGQVENRNISKDLWLEFLGFDMNIEGCAYQFTQVNDCIIGLDGQSVLCSYEYTSTGEPASGTEKQAPLGDQPLPPGTDEYIEQPVEEWVEEAPYTQQDHPLPGDTTTTTQRTETKDNGDQVKIDNESREYIEINGNTYTKTTTTTTTTKSDGTEIVETTVEYSNTGTTTTITDLDDPSQSTTHTAGGGTGSATTTTTTNPDGSSSSSTTQDGDPQEAEEEGEQEQEKFTDQPTQEGILDPFDTLIEGVGQGDLGSAPSYQWSMSTGIGCQAIPWAFGGTNGSWDGYCPFWDQTIRPALAWMVYILTVIALIGIWRDTTKRS